MLGRVRSFFPSSMKKLLLVVSSLVLGAVPVMTSAQEYTDPAVDYVMQQRIMYPAGDGDFDGQGAVSRLEFTLTVVDWFYGNTDREACFSDLAPSSTTRFTRLFSDVDVDEWYAQRLCVGMRAGLIQGNADGTFRPFAPVNTAEAAKILARAYGFPSTSETDAPWYAASMAALRKRRAIADGTAPEISVRRSTMARMYYALRDEEPPSPRISDDFPTGEQETVMPLEIPDISLPIIDETPLSTDDQGDCPISRVNSPGTALLILGIEAHPRRLERRSHRVLEEQAMEAYRNKSFEGPDGGTPAAPERCAGEFVRTLGGGLLFQGISVPRFLTERIPHRFLRAAAQQRGVIDDPRINRNVGY